MTDIAAAAAVSPTTSSPPSSPPSSGASIWSHGGFGFKDLLDIVNPLQHLPIIGSIYRYLTGDEPSGGARLVGDTIYGGPIGFGVSVVTSIISDGDGKDPGERVLAAVFGPRGGSSDTAIAAQTLPSSQPMPAQSVQSAPIPGQAAQIQATPATQLAATLYRSPPASVATAPPSPERNFQALNSQYQRQLTSTQTASGQVLNNKPVPLQLSSNLLPTPRLAQTPGRFTSPPQAVPANAASPQSETAVNPIAQKMLDALDKYERLKKQQEQDDNGNDKAPAGVDLSL